MCSLSGFSRFALPVPSLFYRLKRLGQEGFGSIWTLRSARKARAQERFDPRELAYFNTTGVDVGGKLRNRPRVYGVARFNGNSGFRPECWYRVLHRVFDCEPPCAWNGHQKVLFKKLCRKPERPDAS